MKKVKTKQKEKKKVKVKPKKKPETLKDKVIEIKDTKRDHSIDGVIPPQTKQKSKKAIKKDIEQEHFIDDPDNPISKLDPSQIILKEDSSSLENSLQSTNTRTTTNPQNKSLYSSSNTSGPNSRDFYSSNAPRTNEKNDFYSQNKEVSYNASNNDKYSPVNIDSQGRNQQTRNTSGYEVGKSDVYDPNNPHNVNYEEFDPFAQAQENKRDLFDLNFESKDKKDDVRRF